MIKPPSNDDRYAMFLARQKWRQSMADNRDRMLRSLPPDLRKFVETIWREHEAKMRWLEGLHEKHRY